MTSSSGQALAVATASGRGASHSSGSQVTTNSRSASAILACAGGRPSHRAASSSSLGSVSGGLASRARTPLGRPDSKPWSIIGVRRRRRRRGALPSGSSAHQAPPRQDSGTELPTGWSRLSMRHRFVRDNNRTVVGTAGQLGRQVNRAGALLAEFGKEHGPPFLEGGELSPEALQLAVDPRQLGPRLLFPQAALTVQGPGEILDLAAEQPQPRVPVHRRGPVLQLARVDRREELILRQAVLLASRLVAQRRALASPFSIVEVHVRPLYYSRCFSVRGCAAAQRDVAGG